MKSDFIIALTQLAAERNLPREIVLSAIEAALASAYRRDSIAAGQDISVTLDPGSGDVSVFLVKTVVEEVEDPQLEFTLAEARKIKADAEIDEVVPTESLPTSAGRIAAQTAKQVVIQRLREAERELVFQEFADKEGEVFTVTIQRMEPKQIIVELGRAEAILPPSEQAPYDRYRVGQRIKVLLQSVRQSNKGPEIIVSRADKDLVKRLFEMEVPEIYNGAVEILSIAREAGSRSKVAVWAKQDGVDAVGSCVGLRGIRIQNIVNELHGEKIDVVQWTKDPASFIASALSPSTILRVDVDTENKSAAAIVPDRQLSLAIGKDGQNARLAAKLTGYRVDIKSDVESDDAEAAPGAGDPATMTLEQLGLSTRTLNILTQAGVEKVAAVLEMDDAALLEIKGFGKKSLGELREKLDELVPVAAAPPAKAAKAPAPVEEAVEEAVQEVAEEPAAEVEEEVAPVEEAAVAEVTTDEQPVEAEAEAEPKVEAEAVETAPEAEVEVEAAAKPEPVAAEQPQIEPFIPEEERQPEEALVGAAETSTAIEDLPEDIWSVRRGRAPTPVEEGAIRFAEDIEELKRGTGSRRGRRGGRSRRGNFQPNRARRTGAGGRR